MSYNEKWCLTLPTPRSGHTMLAFDARFYVFGGGNESSMFNELFVFDIANKSWSMPNTSGTAPS